MLAAIHRVYEPGCKFEIMVSCGEGRGQESLLSSGS
ncbi:MAG: hypothetical protein ACLUTU_16260 [Blautia faecis]